MWPIPAFANAALAIVIERLWGYPPEVYRRIRHPVVWFGWLIGQLDALLNKPGLDEAEGRRRGVIAMVVLLLAAFIPARIIASTLGDFSFGWIVDAAIGTAFIAQKSLHDHVASVRAAFEHSLDEARDTVSLIVGRDPRELDESGVTRAALESLAENASDGIVAPVLWYGVFGLPGLVVYKAINTADSMIGHLSERYRHFGWAAARLDDLVNLPASRLTGVLFAAASGKRFEAAIKAMRRDAPKHVSPNAGWPEAALAESLGLQLGGPRSYGGQEVDLATMGSGRAALTRTDIDAGLKLYGRAMTLLFLLMLCGAIVF
jgi:adenosylcobinamide-phosphate synthase